MIKAVVLKHAQLLVCSTDPSCM